MRALISIACLLVFFSCHKKSSTTPEAEPTPTTQAADCQTDQSKRKGAMCMDGSSSTATGSGACSHHGGVEYWICK